MKRIMSIVLVLTLALTMLVSSSLPVYAANEEQKSNNISTDEMVIAGADSTGDLISREFSTKKTEQDVNNGCNIYSVEMKGKQANVSFDTSVDCTLLVAIYDENGKRMLLSGKKNVKSGDTEEIVTIDTSNMPKYFYLRAFLIDSEELNPLCTAYESPNYTKEMVEFLGKTINDFNENQVVNFDESKSNNFAVYSDETKIINQTKDKNSVVKANDSSMQYVFENIDENISSLKPGDVFSYVYQDGKTLVVNVKSIKLTGSTATITGKSADLDEVFDYVKIDASSNTNEAKVDNSKLEAGITYKGKSNGFSASAIESDNSVSRSIAYNLNFDTKSGGVAARLNGSVKLDLTVSTKLYLTKDYQYVELKFETDLDSSLNATGKLDVGFDLGKISLRPVAVVEISLTPRVDAEFGAKAKYGVIISKEFIVAYDSDIGFRNVNKKPEAKTEVSIEGRTYVGVSFKPSVSIISENFVSVYVKAKAGAEMVSDLITPADMMHTHDVKHDCKSCIDGEINFVQELSAGINLFIVNNVEATVFKGKRKFNDFYYSLSRNEFGWGTCPHIQYQILVYVKDSAGKKIEGAEVSVGTKASSDSSGKAVLWLKNGKYDMVIVKKGYKDYKKTFTVHDDKKTLNAEIIGNSIVDDITKPVPPPILDKGKLKVVSSGWYHSAVLTKEGEMFTWGNNIWGQQGNGTASTGGIISPKKVMDNISNISLGARCSGAITNSGDLYTWGENNSGQLGDGTNVDKNSPVKVMESVKSVDMGSWNGAAITKSGVLYTWGGNGFGTLGNGSTINEWKPQKIMKNVKDVSFGGSTAAAVKTDGSLYTWGSEGAGLLGDGSERNRLVPKKIMDNVATVSLAGWAGAAIMEDGSLYTWGQNKDGQLGNGNKENQSTPVKIMENVKYVCMQECFGAAITQDGSLYTWGNNNHGQLGNGTKVSSTLPQKIMDNVKSVSLGFSFGVAIKDDGTIYSWGLNSSGTLGNGSNKLGDVTLPMKISVPGMSKTSVAAASSEHSEDIAELVKLNQQQGAMEAAGSSVSTSIQKKTYSNRYANVTYNLYIMKNRDSKDPLAADNLLYVGQNTANKSGVLTFEYGAKESCSNAEIFTVTTPKDVLDYYNPTIKASSYVYTGKAIKPVPTLKICGKTLKKDSDFKVSYTENKNVGTAYITLIGKGNYRGTKIISFNINPKKVIVSSVKSPTKKEIQVKWKKASQTTGYQVYYSKSSTFKSAKSVKVKGTKTSYTVKKLTSKKKYYVKVRAYKVVNDTYYYGKWSDTKKITVK